MKKTLKQIIYEGIAKNDGIGNLAEAVGVHRATIYHYMNAEKLPRMDIYEALVNAAGYEFELREADVPRCPCELCRHPSEDCSQQCRPFGDFTRALAKRRKKLNRAESQSSESPV